MEYPVHIDTISMEESILYFKWLLVKIYLRWYIAVFLNIVSMSANSVDLDEMWHYA